MNSSIREFNYAGVAQLARASAFQAEGREFESRLPLTLSPLGAVPWLRSALCPAGDEIELRAERNLIRTETVLIKLR